MKKPSLTGLKILRAFQSRETDQFPITGLRVDGIQLRTSMRSVNVYRSTEKLLADGYLSRRLDSNGYFYQMTDAGRAALSTPTSQP